jgi:hypothetical protein
MSDYRSVLEHVGEQFALPKGALERLARRRDRRVRNRRIGAAAVALAVMATVIGSSLLVLRSEEGDRPRPSSPLVIRPGDVSRLQLVWTGITHRHTSTPVVSDGIVYVTTQSPRVLVDPQLPLDQTNRVLAFSATCRDYCSPLWTAEIRGDANTPAVAEGKVFVEAGSELLAFPARCATGGATCHPLWTGFIGRGVPTWSTRDGYIERPPIVFRGVVYVGAEDGLYAFPTSCGTAGAGCQPLWVVPGRVGGLAMSGDEVLAVVGDGVSAFPSSCGASPCKPVWRASVIRGNWGVEIAASDDTLYVGDVLGLRAFTVSSCSTGRCELLWKGVFQNHSHVFVPRITPADGAVYVEDGQYVYAFPSNCKTDGTTCDPTWSVVEYVSDAASVVRDGVVYGTTRTGAWALDAAVGGLPLWTWDSGTGDSPGVAVGGGMVFVGAGDGVYAFGLPEG